MKTAALGAVATALCLCAAASAASPQRYEISLARLSSTHLGFLAVANLLSSGHPARLLETTDFGAHFVDVGPKVGVDTAVDDVRFIDPQHGWVVVWSVNTVRARLYRTGDGGRTWRSTPVASHGAHAGASDTLQFLDARRGWLVVLEPTAPSASLFATRNGGVSWQPVSSLPKIAPVLFQSARVAWQGGGQWAGPLSRSIDGGRTWRPVVLPRRHGAGAPWFGEPASLGRDVFEPVTYVLHKHASVIVYRSADGGRTWHASRPLAVQGVPPAMCGPDPLRVSFVSAAVWWVAARGGVYRSLDGGRHWARRAVPRTTGCRSPGIQAVSRDAAWLEISTPRGTTLLSTRDGGVDWRVVRPA
jgi:photosystem II stability/assembly factor-like uncharacterized protein